MRLKRLELQGFKSFLDRTILTFDASITGVVGPNGCGKSNIVDAILWVMGEQSPKHLRGESMTDVIFAGSDSRSATSMAEVSLILDKQGVALSPQFSAFDKGDEIAITRRIYRDGTGEFLINKAPCRLKDIHELFMDTGVGRRAYSIIEQGQIDRMINVKPEERRLIFEEVAGITKYKLKRKEAERKLEATQLNLTRLHDIIAELEKQIRSLKVQASRARKFRELKTELEAADLYLLGRNLFRLKRTIDELSARREEIVALRTEWEAAFAQSDAEVTQLEVQRLDQEKAYQELGASERDLALRIQKLESQLSLFEERKRTLITANEASVTEEAELTGQISGLVEEKERETQLREDLSVALVAIDEEIGQREGLLRTEQEKRQRAIRERDAAAHRRNQSQQRAIAIDSRRQSAEGKQAELVEAQERLDLELAELTSQLESLTAKLAEADARIDGATTRKETAQREVADAQSGYQTLSQELSGLEDDLFRRREEFHVQRSRLQSLKELRDNLEGYSSSAREILLALGEHGVSATPLAEVLQPEASLEEHLELLLGADMNTLLVKTSEEAEKLARLVQERGLERVKISALSEIEQGAPSAPASGTSLLSRVRVTPGFEAAGRWWLGDAVVVTDADALFVARTGGGTVVSEGSKIIGHRDRAVTAGVQPTSTGVFARRREIDELTALCAQLETDLAAKTAEREACLARLQAQELLEKQLKETLSSLHIEGVEARKEKEKVQLELARAEKDRERIGREGDRLDVQASELRQQLEAWGEELAAAEAERAQGEIELETTTANIEAAEQAVASLGTEINDRRISRSAQQERFAGIESRLMKADSDIANMTRRVENLRAQRERDERDLAGIDGSYQSVVDEKAESQKLFNETLVKLADTKEAFNETCERLQTMRDDLHDLQKKRDAVVEETQELELKLQQERSSYEHLQGLSQERYQAQATPLDDTVPVELEKLPLFAADLPETWEAMADTDRLLLLQEHLQQVRDKVSRYGEVNLTAIQEFDEVQKRYEFLALQREDLESSLKILQEAIVKIDESTKSRFTETFDAVQKKFSEIFPILFAGGRGHLELTNPENELESGVEIMVHPPGKRPSSITLLSGGEKALTAVSLVLAIFARKPSPFCLLDEVDAPLDDANVSRFNTVVRKMAEKTQFIVITHNKKTMEIAEALYGVTMEKAGVSKMTSVRLQ